jgi:hypothetical protein
MLCITRTWHCSPIRRYPRIYHGTRRHIPEGNTLVTPNCRGVSGGNFYLLSDLGGVAAVLTFVVFVVFEQCLTSNCWILIPFGSAAPTSSNFQSTVYRSLICHCATESVVKWIVKKIILSYVIHFVSVNKLSTARSTVCCVCVSERGNHVPYINTRWVLSREWFVQYVNKPKRRTKFLWLNFILYYKLYMFRTISVHHQERLL